MFEGGSIVEGSGVMESDWKVLHHKLRGIAQQRIKLEAEEIGYLVEAEEAQLHRRLGYATFLEYMERELGWGPHAASERLRVAHELLDLPLLHDEFLAGRRCFSVVRELTRVATAETEETWLEKTRGMAVRQVEQLVKGRRKGDAPDDRPDPTIVRERLVFEVGPATAALVRQARVDLERECGRALTDEEVLDTMARRTLAPAEDGPTRPSTQIAVVTCRSCKRGWQIGAGVAMELPAATLERVRCDATEVGDLDADALTRPRSTIPAALRRKVFIRDKGGCTVPGCRSRRHLDVHHVVHQAEGGKHRMQNLTLLCSIHHQQHHDGLISIAGTAPDLVVRWHHDEDVESAVTARPTWDDHLAVATHP